MLRVEGLTVRYGRVAAVRDLSLHCEQGELVTLVGPNGAGKSSTLLAIAGAHERATVDGEIRFDGVDLRGRPAERIVQRGLALVPEGRRIFTTMTVRENLQLGLVAGAGRRGAAALAPWLERFPALAEAIDKPAGHLSGGQQQQLALVRALASGPSLVMLDEPSLGLAPLVIDELFAVIRELRDSGVGILLVEQNALRAVDLADRCYVIRSGRIELEGRGSELAHDEAFLDSYFGTAASNQR